MRSHDSDDDGPRLLEALRRAIPQSAITRACLSDHAIGLLPLISEPGKQPAREDIETHFHILQVMISTFPAKCPSLSAIASAPVALDDFYRHALSKTRFRKRQRDWAVGDAHALRLLICYVF